MLNPLASLVLLALVASPQAETLADKIDREEARQHYRVGERLMAREAFEEAVGEFRAAAGLDPEFVLAQYSLGQALMSLERYAEALVAYIEARDTVVRHSHLNQADRAAAERDRRDQIQELQDSLQKVRSGKIKGLGGATTSLETNIEQRISLLEDAEQRDADSTPRIPAELSLALGSAYYRLGQLEDAERAYRAAIGEKASLGAAHNNLAVVYMMTGRFEEAREEIRAAERAGFVVSPRFKRDLQEKEEAQAAAATP